MLCRGLWRSRDLACRESDTERLEIDSNRFTQWQRIKANLCIHIESIAVYSSEVHCLFRIVNSSICIRPLSSGMAKLVPGINTAPLKLTSKWFMISRYSFILNCLLVYLGKSRQSPCKIQLFRFYRFPLNNCRRILLSKREITVSGREWCKPTALNLQNGVPELN